MHSGAAFRFFPQVHISAACLVFDNSFIMNIITSAVIDTFYMNYLWDVFNIAFVGDVLDVG